MGLGHSGGKTNRIEAHGHAPSPVAQSREGMRCQGHRIRAAELPPPAKQWTAECGHPRLRARSRRARIRTDGVGVWPGWTQWGLERRRVAGFAAALSLRTRHVSSPKVMSSDQCHRDRMLQWLRMVGDQIDMFWSSKLPVLALPSRHFQCFELSKMSRAVSGQKRDFADTLALWCWPRRMTEARSTPSSSHQSIPSKGTHRGPQHPHECPPPPSRRNGESHRLHRQHVQPGIARHRGAPSARWPGLFAGPWYGGICDQRNARRGGPPTRMAIPAAGDRPAINLSKTYTADTQRPTLASTYRLSPDCDLTAGDTATITFSFSEPVTGLIIDDLTIPTGKGTLSDLRTTDGGTNWTIDLRAPATLPANTPEDVQITV